MSPRLLQEISKRRLGGGVISGVATIFDNFSGPDLLKADFIFCFVGIILFLLLFSAACTNTRKLVGRERTPAVLLLIATAFFTIYYGMIFAYYADGPRVLGILSQDASNTLSRVGLQFNYTAIALMLCALLFFNNCTFEFGQPSNHSIGLPSRMWAMIVVGVFYFFATLDNILSGITLATQKNGASSVAILPQQRATNGFFVLYRIILAAISVFLFYCCFVRPRGGAADQFHRNLRNVIAPILILGTIVSLCLAIADVALFEQIQTVIKSRTNLSRVSGFANSRLQVEVGDRINQGLTNFLVILITLSACASFWRRKNKAIPQQLMMMAGPGGYPQQQQGYLPYPQQPYQQQPYPQQPFQQQPYQQQPYQVNDAPHRVLNTNSTPPSGIGYNGYSPQQHLQQQQHPYDSQPGLPYQPQTAPSPPIAADSK